MGAAVEINSFIDVIVKSGLGFAGFLFVIGVVVWRRTRSTHILMSRLWVLFNGKQKCEVPSIKNFLDVQSAVLQFRFMTGLQARTFEHVKSLIWWTKKNDEDMGDVAACGEYFDLALPGLKDEASLPKTWFLIVLATVTSLLAFVVISSLSATFVDGAILRMKKSGTWFILDQVSAKPILEQGGFKLDTCSSSAVKIAEESAFSTADVEIICKAFARKETVEYVKSNVYAQRMMFGWLSVYFGYFCVIAFSYMQNGFAARKMWRRLAARRALDIASADETG